MAHGTDTREKGIFKSGILQNPLSEAHLNPENAVAEFCERVSNYEKTYVPLGVAEEEQGIQQHGTATTDQKPPIQKLFNDLFPSSAFRKWLALNYTLASGYDGEEPRLEFTLGLTPTLGWEKKTEEDEEDDEDGEAQEKSKAREPTAAEEPAVPYVQMIVVGRKINTHMI
ncbi:hypothetical protein Asppvi_005419 [Aspergillus pseudoviridinutans]|uniref:Uncharacterized protein n=1 Tax=Aspergillus pseudoviridinutans TaxID=1517512 RepID=A0A9P3EV80_9EURO|nr:uncharacterized protein Asppvi_005419 [Aspergillus pseudoviridinutans]GIJ86530.1 hypothetical protein Asppvi_005419 [Aspergillus pseudoviridinutans]